MNRRSTRTSLALAIVAMLAPAAAAQEHSGGAAAPATGGSEAISDGSYTLVAKPGTMLGKIARFRGFVPVAEAGRAVTIERFAPLTAEWTPLATTVVEADGTFIARWRTDHIGQFQIRARLDADDEGARAASASPEVEVTVFKPALATWYGPGFYGRRTACGQTMGKRLQGVAHKRLRCGTKVALYYKGRTRTVRVVDRGPYAKGRVWDLTAATAKALEFKYTDEIGAVALR